MANQATINAALEESDVRKRIVQSLKPIVSKIVLLVKDFESVANLSERYTGELDVKFAAALIVQLDKILDAMSIILEECPEAQSFARTVKLTDIAAKRASNSSSSSLSTSQAVDFAPLRLQLSEIRKNALDVVKLIKTSPVIVDKAQKRISSPSLRSSRAKSHSGSSRKGEKHKTTLTTAGSESAVEQPRIMATTKPAIQIVKAAPPKHAQSVPYHGKHTYSTTIPTYTPPSTIPPLPSSSSATSAPAPTTKSPRERAIPQKLDFTPVFNSASITDPPANAIKTSPRIHPTQPWRCPKCSTTTTQSKCHMCGNQVPPEMDVPVVSPQKSSTSPRPSPTPSTSGHSPSSPPTSPREKKANTLIVHTENDAQKLSAKWQCSQCGMYNRNSAERCAMCGEPKPEEFHIYRDWHCELCDTVNPGTSFVCSECSQERDLGPLQTSPTRQYQTMRQKKRASENARPVKRHIIPLDEAKLTMHKEPYH